MTNNEDNVLQKLTKIIVNYSKFPRSCFVFAHKGNSLPGEQNKIGFIKRQWRQFRHQLLSISLYPKIIINYSKLFKITWSDIPIININFFS